MPFSRGSSQPKDQIQASYIAGKFFTTREAQEYWSGYPIPFLEGLPNPGIEPGSPTLQADSLPAEPPGQAILLPRVLLKDKSSNALLEWRHAIVKARLLIYSPKTMSETELGFICCNLLEEVTCLLVVIPIHRNAYKPSS